MKRPGCYITNKKSRNVKRRMIRIRKKMRNSRRRRKGKRGGGGRRQRKRETKQTYLRTVFLTGYDKKSWLTFIPLCASTSHYAVQINNQKRL